MIVYINDKKIETFSGAKIKDAVLKYSKDDYKAVGKETADVVDTDGNGYDLDGSLSEGQRLFIKKENED